MTALPTGGWTCGWLQEVSLGLQMVNLTKCGTFINDLRAKCRAVRAAATVELRERATGEIKASFGNT